jgi:hypothetical protein
VHRQRLGREPPQVRRAVEVRVGCTLERSPREPEPIAHGCWIAGPLVRGGPVRASTIACIALHRAADLIRGAEQRLDATALHRIMSVERQAQNAQAIVSRTRPGRLLVRTSFPLPGRPHRSFVHLPHDIEQGRARQRDCRRQAILRRSEMIERSITN